MVAEYASQSMMQQVSGSVIICHFDPTLFIHFCYKCLLKVEGNSLCNMYREIVFLYGGQDGDSFSAL